MWSRLSSAAAKKKTYHPVSRGSTPAEEMFITSIRHLPVFRRYIRSSPMLTSLGEEEACYPQDRSHATIEAMPSPRFTIGHTTSSCWEGMRSRLNSAAAKKKHVTLKTAAMPRSKPCHHLNSPPAGLPTLHRPPRALGNLGEEEACYPQDRSHATIEAMPSPRFTIGRNNTLPRLFTSRSLDVPLLALVPRSRLDLKGLICHA